MNRNEQIYALRAQKWTLQRIGEKFGLSRERVRQILLGETHKANRREYERRPEMRDKKRQYYQRPDVKDRQRKYMRKYQRKYRNRSEVKHPID